MGVHLPTLAGRCGERARLESKRDAAGRDVGALAMNRREGLEELLVGGAPGERGEKGAAERLGRARHRVEQVACGAGDGGV